MDQLRACLVKNCLLKWRDKWQTLVEIAIPPAFLLLLVWIRQLTSKYDSPSVAYCCGQAFPFQYQSDLVDPSATPLFSCLLQPQECIAPNYYRDPFNLSSSTGIEGLSTEYGWLPPLSTKYPFYSFTVGDESSIYDEFRDLVGLPLLNPSLPMQAVARRLRFKGQECFIAVSASNELLDAAVEAAKSFALHLDSVLAAKDETLVGVVRLFEKEDQILEYIRNDSYDDGRAKVGFAIIFNDGSPTWDYSLRFNFSYGVDAFSTSATCLYGECSTDGVGSLPSTNFVTTPLLRPPTSENLSGYGFSGFLAAQREVDEWILRSAGGGSKPVRVALSAGLFPEEEYHTDEFYEVTGGLLGIFYILAFLYPVNRMVRTLVTEKEDKSKELMSIMGLPSVIYHLSWFIVMVLQLFVSSLIIFFSAGGIIFEFSSGALVLLWFLALSLSLISFCFLLSTFFGRAKAAATLGSVLYFAAYFPYYYVGGQASSSFQAKVWASLLAPCAIALSGDTFALYERGQVGVQLSNVGESYEHSLSYSAAVGVLVLDSFLYILLTWYLDNVLPTQFGTPRPWYYPLARLWRWCRAFFIQLRRNREAPESELVQPLLPVAAALSATPDLAGGPFDPPPSHLEPAEPELQAQFHGARQTAISLEGLRKVYPDGKEAVCGMRLRLYEGHITVLLGANGAGKTSLLSVLTGLTPMSGGDAHVRGVSLRQNLPSIRSILGFCPQSSVLWPTLSVLEHLRLYATIKGVAWVDREGEALSVATEVGLGQKLQAKVSSLSGGMKRKLSVGLALIGGSKFCILDEPSTGLDEYSRRELWGIIQRRRRGRTFLITTHYMDEAENLGTGPSGICVMANGKLECAGSSLFLKQLYAVGYTLTVSGARSVSDLVFKCVPSAKVLSFSGLEHKYRLPFESASRLPSLFLELEAIPDISFGIDTTTLEEVFLQAGQAGSTKAGEDEDEEVEEEKSEQMGSGKEAGALPDVVPVSFFARFTALLRKRISYGLRDKKAVAYQLLIPTVLQLVGLLLLRASGKVFEQPSLALDPVEMYNTDFDAVSRVPLPIQLSQSASPLAGCIAKLLPGEPIPIDEEAPDQFAGCAQGATELLRMSNALLSGSVHPSTGASVYGAVTFANSTAETDDGVDITYNLLVNASAVHSVPAFANAVNSAALGALSGACTGKRARTSAPSITVRSHPLPQTALEAAAKATLDAFTVAIMVVTSFCFIPASYAIFIVKERETMAKQQQLLAGVGPLSYWTSTLAYDCGSYLVPWAIGLVLLLAFSVPGYTNGESGGAAALLLLLYGLAVAPFTYAACFFFSSHSSAFNGLLLLNFISGLALMITSFVLSLLDNTWKINLALKNVYRLFPGFSLGDGLLQLALCTDDLCPVRKDNSFEFGATQRPLAWDVAGGDLAFLLITFALYSCLTLGLEVLSSVPRFRRVVSAMGVRGIVFPAPPSSFEGAVVVAVDENVADEEARVMGGGAAGDAIVMKRLRKVYPGSPTPKVAVQQLSLGIERGACFGLLGPNGAGKSSIQGILAGVIDATSGDCHVGGQNVLSQWHMPRGVGFCPQSDDPLFDFLTVQEHLDLFSRLKGASREEAVSIIREMKLTPYANIQAANLSGGSKRKLSFALAALGRPTCILLDEPSAGMDPVSRRFFWDVLRRVRLYSTVVLTSHSMEEVENTCSGVGIMLEGCLRCLGTIQHLKSRFGRAMEVQIRLHLPSDEDVEGVAAAVRKARLTNSMESGAPLEALWGSEKEELCRALDQYHALGDQQGWGGALASTGAYLLPCTGGQSPTLAELCGWASAEIQMSKASLALNAKFPGTILSERGSSLQAKFSVPIVSPPVSLSQLFGWLESMKVDLHIDAYSVGQQTLQSIFNNFAAASSSLGNSSSRP